nr:MAG TPA: hypothetical protein [Caudoviricetes sp.]
MFGPVAQAAGPSRCLGVASHHFAVFRSISHFFALLRTASHAR